jgi:hypothetical protein
MARTADSWRFRARAERLFWSGFARERLAFADELKADPGKSAEQLKELIEKSREDIRLSWTCSPELGVPRGPFTVWTRRADDQLEKIDTTQFPGEGLGLWWGGIEAGCVEVVCRPSNVNEPVALLLFRYGGSPRHVVSAGAVNPGGASLVTVRVRTPGATFARLINAFDPQVAIDPLRRIVNDDEWNPIEIVGLPVDRPWAGTVYDDQPQGFIGAEVEPMDAAIDRLDRGGPPLGWWPVTEDARTAPKWEPPDPVALVKEVRDELLDELVAMYDGATTEDQQSVLTDLRNVDGPSQAGRTSTLPTTVDVGPWAKLVLPAQSDPFLNLACGFGTAYRSERDDREMSRNDFLVTAKYSRVPFPMDSNEVAAYAPAASRHGIVPEPTGLGVERMGLIAPPVADLAWRESIRLSWDRVEPTASMPPLVEAALAVYDAGSSDAVSLLPERDAGGPRPFLLGTEAPEGQPGNDRVALVHGEVAIPIGSGGRDVGYAIAVSDVFGVWSRWQDVGWSGDEPGPQPPRVVSLALTTSYAGALACPTTLETEVAVEWLERTPTSLEVVALFFPMASPAASPPAGLSPDLPVPAGCFRRDLGLSFVGDTPVPSGCTVASLNPAGDAEMTPGPGQGDGGRRYRLHAKVPTLDFGSTNRWGVQLFVRRAVAVGVSPTAWAPEPSHPALASAASPVPVLPLPPPAPPGVPLGSTLDADGRSHVRVHWSLPAGADVRTCIVWEAAETALRQRAGLSQHADATDPPGVRLAALWSAYDTMSPTARRATFRRVVELDGTAREHDFALPKGSTDIHLFVVTTMTRSGVESPWPEGATPHEHLQAVIAPRLLRPGPPTIASRFDDAGTLTMRLRGTGAIPVTSFRLYRTRSEVAARKVETMGPAFAEVSASVVAATSDPVLRTPVYEATWTGAFPENWDPWLVRAVAVPPDSLPVAGVRGVPSAASDVVSLLVPPTGPPTLEPLVAELWGADNRGVVVRSATTAPARALTIGTHTLAASAGAQALAPTAIETLDETALTTPPTSAVTDVVLERGVRAGGQSPLALWFTRPVAADPVDVSLRLVDPLGRAVEHTLTVPGWVPPPPMTVRIVGTMVVVGRGVNVEFDCDASVDPADGIVLHIAAAQRLRRILPPPRRLSTRIALADVPDRPPLFPRARGIQVVRTRRPGEPTSSYAAWIPLNRPVAIEIAVEAPDGSRATDTATA